MFYIRLLFAAVVSAYVVGCLVTVLTFRVLTRQPVSLLVPMSLAAVIVLLVVICVMGSLFVTHATAIIPTGQKNLVSGSRTHLGLSYTMSLNSKPKPSPKLTGMPPMHDYGKRPKKEE